MVVAPHVTGAPSGTLEVSVHRLGPAARAELPSVLPAAPGRRPIHVVVTFQFARPSVSRALEADAFSDPPTAAQVDSLQRPASIQNSRWKRTFSALVNVLLQECTVVRVP